MKKNNIKYILPFILLLPMGCDDDLNLTPESVITVSSFFQNEDDARSAAAGMYSALRGISNSLYIYGDERADNTEQTDLGTGNDANRNTIKSSTGGADWSGFYNILKDVNNVIDRVPDVTFTSDTEKKQILGEAYFIRAWTYFMMARVWGDVPLVLVPISSPGQPEALPDGRDAIAAVFTQIKADIESSLGFFPDNAISDRNRASKPAANMLKAEVFLWTAKLQGGGSGDLNTAKSAIDQVIGHGDLSLQADYKAMFATTSATGEDIFSLYRDINEGGSLFATRYNVSDSFWANLSDADKAVIPFVSGSVRFYTTTQRFRDQIVANANGNTDSREAVYFLEYTDPSGDPRHIMNKYEGESVGNNVNQMTDDFKVYRYADAILVKAEIENALGNTSVAITNLNLIRNRVGIGNYPGSSTSEAVDEAILQERGIELAFEAKRFFDLVRFRKAYELVPTLIGRETEQPILWPITVGTRSLNPSLQQTPGYTD